MKITCRICRKQQGNFFGLDSELYLPETTVTISAVDILRENFNLNVELADDLPQTLCIECFTRLKEFYEFILLGQQSEKELRKILYNDSDNDDDETIVIMPDSTENETMAKISRAQDNITNENEMTVKCSNDGTIEIEAKLEESFYPEQQPDEEMWIQEREHENQKCIDSDNGEIGSYVLLNDMDCTSEHDDYQENNRLLTHLDQPTQTTSNTHAANRKYIQHTIKYTCEFCYKNFNTRSSLKSHLNTHSHDKPYQCTICGQTFQQSTKLKGHMSLHIGKTIQCHVCQKRFSRPGHLNIHLRQHNINNTNNDYCLPSSISPTSYKCDQCPEAFNQQSELEQHTIVAHSNNNGGTSDGASANTTQNNFSEFDKSFSKKTLLALHGNDEHKTQAMVLYCCNKCNVEFTSRNGLFHHIKLQHLEANHI